MDFHNRHGFSSLKTQFFKPVSPAANKADLGSQANARALMSNVFAQVSMMSAVKLA